MFAGGIEGHCLPIESDGRGGGDKESKEGGARCVSERSGETSMGSSALSDPTSPGSVWPEGRKSRSLCVGRQIERPLRENRFPVFMGRSLRSSFKGALRRGFRCDASTF